MGASLGTVRVCMCGVGRKGKREVVREERVMSEAGEARR